jgi:very-long-chain (3R)-3-hydroxyacyl-CoA dehydratase
MKTYLKAYNLLLGVGWGVFLVYFLLQGMALSDYSLMLLNVCQVAALLEIVHAGLKWTSSPVVTTALQVFSRVFVLYWINVIPADRQIELLDISGITIVSLAWGVTEVVRYNYYFFTLLNKPLQVLHYLRYTLFIILYPLGITGEGMIMLSALKVNEWQISLTNGIIVIVLLSYIPFFPKLYGYMWKQRRKKLQ